MGWHLAYHEAALQCQAAGANTCSHVGRMVPIAYDDSVTVKAPARSALGHVTPEEFEQLSTNGAVES